MKTSKWTKMTPLIVSIVAWPCAVFGQTESTPPGSYRPWNEPANRWQKVSDVIGKNVETTSGEKLGDVDNLIVDIDSGRVISTVVKCDGKLCAVPTTALNLQGDGKKFTISSTKDQLKAYSFEKNSYPNFGDRTWASQVYSHYNQPPYWERSGKTDDMHPWYRFTSHWLKATDINGEAVKNPQGEDLGKIEDLVIDPDGARVIYAVLSFGGVLGIGDKLFAIPMSSLDPTADNKHFTLNVEKDRLKNAQGFDKKNWPNMADQRWATETHTYYQQRPYWEEPPATGEPRTMGQEREEVWVCSMHPSVRQNKSGNCTICQMALVRESKP